MHRVNEKGTNGRNHEHLLAVAVPKSRVGVVSGVRCANPLESDLGEAVIPVHGAGCWAFRCCVHFNAEYLDVLRVEHRSGVEKSGPRAVVADVLQRANQHVDVHPFS
eukprot:7309073-Pyramimonas_sp.AAC.1